jgi:hypothetical protein
LWIDVLEDHLPVTKYAKLVVENLECESVPKLIRSAPLGTVDRQRLVEKPLLGNDTDADELWLNLIASY